MLDPQLFHGIAVIVDDELLDEKENIRKIQTQIEAAGCHVVGMTKLPTDTQLANLGGASFFIVDWNLVGRPPGDESGLEVTIPEALKKQFVGEIIAFLKKLKQVRVAPVFVFTNEPPDAVKEELNKHPELSLDTDPSHILVLSKGEVIDKGVFNVLSNWLQQAPSAYVLKRWEAEYEKAKNELFLDFYNKSVLWPLLLKKTFEEDDVHASIEMGNLIGRNLLSRMTPFEFDLDAFDPQLLSALQADDEKYRTTLLDVLEGERFLSQERLHATSVAPGDIFKDGKHYYINIRPECDCIVRNGNEQDAVELYLLRGSKLSAGQIKIQDGYGQLEERDVNIAIFALKDGASFSFQFKDLYKRPWLELKDKRIGRLLPPFLTRLQQRYAAYLQRPGLPRIPLEALPAQTVEMIKPTGPDSSKEGP